MRWHLRRYEKFTRALRLCIPLIVICLVASCHRRTTVVTPPPAPRNPALAVYASAETSFNVGDYPAAIKAYENYLRANVSENQDRVHFRLGLAYALIGRAPQNIRDSRLHLQRVAAGFPKSPYRAEAEFILSLEAEIERLSGSVKEQQEKIRSLTEELQRLKEIDMKRRPTRPPG